MKKLLVYLILLAVISSAFGAETTSKKAANEESLGSVTTAIPTRLGGNLLMVHSPSALVKTAKLFNPTDGIWLLDYRYTVEDTKS